MRQPFAKGKGLPRTHFVLARAKSKTPEFLTALIKLLRLDASIYALDLLLWAAWSVNNVVWEDLVSRDLQVKVCFHCGPVGSGAIVSIRPSEYFCQICWATIILFMQVFSVNAMLPSHTTLCITMVLSVTLIQWSDRMQWGFWYPGTRLNRT
jgi:hypothetical protein